MNIKPVMMTFVVVLGLFWQARAAVHAQGPDKADKANKASKADKAAKLDPEEAREQAREAIARADSHLGKQEYDLAITEIQRAYELDPQDDHLYNFGVAYSLKGDKKMAYTYFQKYLDAKPKNRALIKRARSQLDEIGLALTDELMREREDIRVALEQAEAKHRKEMEAARASARRDASTSAPPSSRGRFKRATGIGLAAAGGLALGAAIVYGLDARSANNELDGLGETDEWTVSRDWLYDRGQASERNMILFSITGAVLVGGGAVLYYMGERDARSAARERPAPAQAVSAMPTVGPNYTGMVVAGHF